MHDPRMGYVPQVEYELLIKWNVDLWRNLDNIHVWRNLDGTRRAGSRKSEVFSSLQKVLSSQRASRKRVAEERGVDIGEIDIREIDMMSISKLTLKS